MAEVNDPSCSLKSLQTRLLCDTMPAVYPKIDASLILDLLKWLLAGIAGYLVHEWKDFGKRRRLRANLYRELSHNYEEIVRTLTAVEQNPYLAPVFPGNARLSLAYHNFAIGEGKSLFYDLSDCSVLKQHADDLITLINGSGRTGVHEGMMFAYHIEKAIADGQLDERLFRKVSSSTARELLASHAGSRKMLTVGKQ